MTEPKWVHRTALELLHAESLARFGGAEGMRDAGLLESALARPQHLFHYYPDSSIGRLSAAYSVGLIRNHPFVDGNKRAGLLAMLIFLEINGYQVAFEKTEAIAIIQAVASGDLDEDSLARWITKRLAS